jgi:hypothetical protein
MFDRYAATEAAAHIVTSAVFSPQRAERLATQRALNTSLPSFFEVMQAFSTDIILKPYSNMSQSAITHEIARAQSEVVVEVEVGAEAEVVATTTATAVPAYLLEGFIAQSLVVNSYLTLLVSPLSSNLVKSQVKVHLLDLKAMLLKIMEKLEGSSTSTSSITGTFPVGSSSGSGSDSGGDSGSEGVLEVRAHLRMLSDSIAPGKPFLTLLETPLGPPI